MLKQYVMKWSRGKKLEHFYSLRSNGMSVLDVGVSSVDYSDQVNIFMKSFRDVPALYTGLAVQNIDEVQRNHPDKRFVRYDGKIFPFSDKEFDWAFSNAVIEHVGNKSAQLLFLTELLRTSHRVFFTTPSKYFPVESHTNTVFRHWHSRSFYRWCKMDGQEWSQQNLLLLTKADLVDLMDRAGVTDYQISSNRILGWPMTYTVVCSSAI